METHEAGYFSGGFNLEKLNEFKRNHERAIAESKKKLENLKGDDSISEKAYLDLITARLKEINETIDKLQKEKNK